MIKLKFKLIIKLLNQYKLNGTNNNEKLND